MNAIVSLITDPAVIISVLVGVAVIATGYTLLPSLSKDPVKARMKSVALERDSLRAKQRSQLGADKKRGGLREEEDTQGIATIVEKFDLKKALVDEQTMRKLRSAGFRSKSALTKFLFFRLIFPFIFALIAVIYVYVLGGLPDQNGMIKICVVVFAAYAGFYLPNLYVTNIANKRRASIKRNWPDALDLLLICVESGVSVEAAFRRVSEEIGVQSVELAEELVLTTAELSYLSERRQAFERLADRVGLDSVKSVCQALIQAERYGTPVAQALRVLAAESRDQRMNEAEKKAAALPPKLTVPMILFFLPVLFVIILGPAIMSISGSGAL